MKNASKRIIALILTLCMTLSVLPPMVFAVEGEQNPGQNTPALDRIVYDFDLRDKTYEYAAGDIRFFAGTNLTQNTVAPVKTRAVMDELYAAKQINWDYHSVGNVSSSATNTDFAFTYGGTGVNYSLNLRAGASSNQIAGGYFAATIRSPGTADYKLTLDYFTHTTGAAQASVYILPAETTDIAAAIAANEAIGTFSCESSVASATALGEGAKTFNTTVSMEADKEYLLVFTTDALSSQNSKRASLYLGKVTLDKVVDTAKQIVYDFALVDAGLTNNGATFHNLNCIGTGTSATNRRNAVAAYYEAEVLNWKFHSQTGSHFLLGDSAQNWGGYAFMYKSASAVPYPVDYYFAMTVRSPGAGEYKMTLNYGTHSKGAPKGSVYILPGNTTNIPEAIALNTAVGSVNYQGTATVKATAASTSFDTVIHMQENTEYLLVFTADVAGSSVNAIYVDSVKLTEKEQVIPEETTTPEETTSPEETTAPDETTAPEETLPPVQADQLAYDFDLRDKTYEYAQGDIRPFANNNLATINVAASKIKAAMDALYASGDIHWDYHSVGNTSAGSAAGWNFTISAATANYSLSMVSQHKTGSFFAATIRSPGTGNYKFTVNYAIHSTGASKASVYLLPGNTTDIAAAIAAGTAIATFSCDDPAITSATNLGAGMVTTDNYLPMEAGKDYLLVFTNDEVASTRADRASLYLNSVIATKEGTQLPGAPTQPDNSADPLAPVQRDQIVYEYGLPDMGLTYGDNVTFESRNLCSSVAGRTAVADLYANGTINWKFHSKPDGLASSAFTLGKISDFYNLIMYAKDADKNVIGAYYYATTIRSPGTGDYKLTVDYYVHPNGAEKGSIYILPNNVSDIAAAIAGGEAVGVIRFDNGKTKEAAARITFDKLIPMELGKEYIMVFTSDGEGRTNAALYLDRVTLTKSGIATPENIVPEMEAELERVEIQTQRDQVVYDFDLGHSDLTYMGNTFATANLITNGVQNTVKTFYKYGITDWKYHSTDMESGRYVVFGGVGAKSEMKWPGVCIYSRDPATRVIHSDYYYAFTIRSPGTGNYKLTLDYGAHMNGAKQGSIYILSADTTDIRAAIEAGKAIGTVNYDNGAISATQPAMPGRSTYGNAIAMEAGKEYILVFTSDVAGRAHAALYVDSVTLTREGVATPADIIPERKPEPKPIPAGSTVYNVDLCDPLNGTYKNKTFILDAIDEINSRYANGTSNWSWADHEVLSEGSMAFVTTGMSIYSGEMEWIALKIKSPGKGLYTIGANHAISSNCGTVAMYVLPADTEDISAALDIDNRVGKMTFTDMSGNPTTQDGSQSLAGTWEFGEDEEYILVVEAYKKTIYNETRSYMILSQIFMTPGDIMEETVQEKIVAPVVVDPGPIKVLDPTYYGATAQVNGDDYLFMPCEGRKMLVFDLDNNRIVGEVDIPHTRTYGVEVDPDGNIWTCGGDSKIFRYDPITGVGEVVLDVTTLLPEAKNNFYMKYANGFVYFGLYPCGSIGWYEIATGKAGYFGCFSEDSTYINAVEYKDGYLYAGLTGDKNSDGNPVNLVVKVDATTGELAGSLDVSHLVAEDHKIFMGSAFAGDLLLMGSSSADPTIMAIDTNTMEYVDLGIRSYISVDISEEVDGKIYFVLGGMGLHSMDVNTREIRLVPGFKDTSRPLRCCRNSVVEIDDPLYPGPSIVTYSSANGDPLVYNLQTGKTKSYFELIGDDYGNGATMRTLINGEPGSNMLYMGAYNTPACTAYNTETGEIFTFDAFSAQTDSLVLYKGVLYAGNYTAGCITRVNMEDDSRNQVLLTLRDEVYNQARIHTMTAGDDKIFAGSTPYSFDYGGCLAWVDLNTLERHVVRNVVQDQTVNCVIYHDGLVYGTTSIHGGSGTTLREDLSAKLFIYDVDNKEKLAEFDLRDYISGIEGNIHYLSGIAADPNVDENGKFWGLISETLFSFTYDRETGKLSVKEELSFGKNTYPTGGSRNWFPKPFRFDDQGNLYLAFEENGGMRRINTNDISDNERIMPLTPQFYALGEDGNMYYVWGSALHVYPLGVTEEDWIQADKVDQMFLALPEEITLKSEEAIVAARAAYDALDMRYKALIQHLEILEEAEVELLELQIDALDETVTLEHETQIKGLVAKYKAMTKRQKLYVKNYEALKDAEKQLNILIDKKLAAEVQAMIDTIKDLGQITLEHKDRIAEIRAAYNALYTYQKIYVDATDLLAAEAILAELRAAEIERLKQLIASIGEVTLEDEPVIVEADSIFSWLTLEEREQVDGATLSSAKIQLAKLQKAAAAEVDALIGKIGKVGLFSGISITKARKAYDALTEGSKAYVSLIDTLLAAEKAFAPLRIVFWSGIVAIVAAGGIATVLVVNKRKAAKAKTEETVE